MLSAGASSFNLPTHARLVHAGMSANSVGSGVRCDQGAVNVIEDSISFRFVFCVFANCFQVLLSCQGLRFVADCLMLWLCDCLLHLCLLEFHSFC
jgi:hypothetical protein